MPIIDQARRVWESSQTAHRRKLLERACGNEPHTPAMALLAWHDVPARERIILIKFIRDNKMEPL